MQLIEHLETHLSFLTPFCLVTFPPFPSLKMRCNLLQIKEGAFSCTVENEVHEDSCVRSVVTYAKTHLPPI